MQLTRMTLCTLACPGQGCGYRLIHHSPELHGVLLNHLLPTCTRQTATHTPRLMPTRLREAQHAEAGPITPLQLGKLADATVQLIQHLSAAQGNQAHDNDATHTYRDVICREAGDDKLVKGIILARALNALHELTKLSRHDNNKRKRRNCWMQPELALFKVQPPSNTRARSELPNMSCTLP